MIARQIVCSSSSCYCRSNFTNCRFCFKVFFNSNT